MRNQVSLCGFDWVSEFLKELVRRERLAADDDQRIDARRAYTSGDREKIATQIVVSVRAKGVKDDPLDREVLLDELLPESHGEYGQEIASYDDEVEERVHPRGDGEDFVEGQGAPKGDVGSSTHNEEENSQENNDHDGHRGTRIPDQKRRKKLFSSGYRPIIENNVLAKLHREIRSIDVSEYPTSSLFLVRSYLEVVFGLFSEEKNLDDGNKQLELRKKIVRACDYLMSDENEYKEMARSEGNGLKQLRTIASDSSRLFSPDKINNIIHGGAPAPAYSEVIDAWANIEKEVSCVIRALWNH